MYTKSRVLDAQIKRMHYEFYLDSSGERKSKVEHETSFRRGDCSKRSMTLTYVSRSISVSQRNITKLEREADRHASQTDKSVVCTFAKRCHTDECFPSRISRRD